MAYLNVTTLASQTSDVRRMYAKPYWTLDDLTTTWRGATPMAANTVSGATWPSANLIIYTPVTVHTTVTAYRAFYVADATASTGNVNMGIYDFAGNKLLETGSTAKSSGMVLTAFAASASVALKPGIYYHAMQCSNATDTFHRYQSSAPIPSAMGWLYEAAGSFVLPTTATWAIDIAQLFIPMVGFTTNSAVT